jgi:DNA helicase-2/ATP-dependent DNA helicase PcrA
VTTLTEGLNPEQASAVVHVDGPLLILAGAGSGKTRVLTRRIAYLLEQGVRPWNILAVTFTNKAAGEMKERVAHLVGPTAKDIQVSTFHSTCVRILRRDIAPLGWTSSFVIYDDDDQTRVLKQILADLKLDPKRHPPASFRSAIDRAKNSMREPDEGAGVPYLVKVYRAYTERLKAANALDFNDIVNKVVDLWRQEPAVRDRWRARFRYVLVDEYQDTNPAQYELVKLLCDFDSLEVVPGVTVQGRNLAVVGDDDQSIYSFRGADIRNILDFEKDFPSAKVVRLEQNYRSTATILEAASALVRRNTERKDKTLWTDAGRGDAIRLMRSEDENEEAARVVGEIRRQLPGRRPGDFAIIYRTNAQSRPFEQALTQARIPFVLVGGRKFYERREVRDIVSYLKLVVNPADDVAFTRVINTPTRGIGEKALEQISSEADRLKCSLREAARYLGQAGGRLGGALTQFTTLMDTFQRDALVLEPGQLALKVARDTGYLAELEAEKTDEARGRIENIDALARATEEEEPQADADSPAMPIDRLRAFLDRVSLAGQADELPDEGAGAVTLLTAHLAKGLEYPVVFGVGWVDGVFPSGRAEREGALEEERRLAYVTITRAREQLCLSFPGRRMSFDRRPGGTGGPTWEDCEPSRFLAELPRTVLTGDVPRERAPTRTFGGPPAPPARTQVPSWMHAQRAANAARPAPLPPARPAASLSAPPARPAASSAAPPRSSPVPGRGVPPRVPDGMRKLVPESLDAFREGAEVFHPMFGAGTISKREGIPSNPKLTVHFRDHGPRTVFAVVAGLEILLP